MEQFLSQLARQSLTAGWMILALLVLRPLLKKAPRSFLCLLWAFVAVRLVTPFSFQSRVSLVPQSIAAPTRITPILPELPVSALEQPTVQAAAPVRGIAWGQVLTAIWLMGVAAMAVYALVSYIRLINRVQVSIRIQDKLYLCDNVRSPFVLGIFRPRIYLPSDMEPRTTAFVLAHEQAHLRRGDHLWKPLGYAILCIHWFNPLCWLAYILFCRDMEQACDEAVIRNMTSGDKKAYSAALLKCSLPRSAIAVCPLAFGEISVKQRIRGVLSYRKPKFWVVAVSAVLCVVLAACFLTDPVEASGNYTVPEGQDTVIYKEPDVIEPDDQQAETYSFTREDIVYSSPAEIARTLRQAVVGEECTVLRREFVNEGSWGFVQFPSDGVQGWVHFVEDDEALAYFREYVDSCSQSAPDAAESYLYFASDYAREFFRENYAPITGWYPSGIFRVNENLWGILFTDSAEERSVYSFVGRMDDRLYVFQNVHQVPDALSENLDVASYEEENAMYLSDEYMECSWVIKRLLEFADPVKVELQEDGTGKYAGGAGSVVGSISYADMVCGTDTWRVIREIPDAVAHCTITLCASDGSTARFWDVDGSVLVTYPDGSQACYRVDFNGEEIISMLYDWAKAKA